MSDDLDLLTVEKVGEYVRRFQETVEESKMTGVVAETDSFGTLVEMWAARKKKLDAVRVQQKELAKLGEVLVDSLDEIVHALAKCPDDAAGAYRLNDWEVVVVEVRYFGGNAAVSLDLLELRPLTEVDDE